MDKKEYTPREAAVSLLDRVKKVAQERLTKSAKEKEEALAKAANPANENSAQMAGLKVPQPAAAPATEKVLPKQKELKLKKFMDTRSEKKLKKAESK